MKKVPNSPHFPDQLLKEDSLPYKIGSNITIKEYNKFLECQESSGYKYQQRDNGDVLIIDMSNSEHGLVASLLQDYFKVANGGVIINPPIVIGIDKFHFSPSGNDQLIASDVMVYPNASHVQQPRIPYPGPPPGNRNGWPHAQVVCEVGNSQSTKEWNDKSMMARLWQQGAGYQESLSQLHKSFWDPVLPLPLSPAVEYVPAVPNPLATETAPVNFIIDLYQVQQLVLSEQDNA
ncbi:2005_t:CDS:2, partial [Entrophospora sp. SA101]